MVRWDPDGAGPMASGVVVSGPITIAGSTMVDGVAFLDLSTQTFTRLGTPNTGTSSPGIGVFTGPQGELFGVAGQRVLRWTGLHWQPLSMQMDGQVFGLVVLANGEIVIGGSFHLVDGNWCPGMARLTATGWSSVGFDTGTSVSSLARLPNGDVLVAGDLVHSMGTGGMATLNGNTVSFLLGAPSGVFSTLVAPNGDLFVSASQPAVGIYRRSGGVWSALTTQGSFGWKLHLAPNGDLYVGGGFATFEGVPCNNVARFNGSTWSALGSGVSAGWVPRVSAIVDAPNGGILVGGAFLRAGNVGVTNLARWDGTFWNPLGVGLNAPVRASLALPNGDLIVAGDFADLPDANGARCHRIARRSNGQWFAMGSGLDGGALSLARLPNGDIVVGGSFQHAGGVLCNNLARWDGTNWHAYGSGTNAYVHAVEVLPNGDLIAGGYFTLANGVAVARAARWDGAQFQPFGNFNGGVEHFAVRANGSVVAVGAFTFVDGQPAERAAQRSGGTWSAMGAGLPTLSRNVVESTHGQVFAITTQDAFAWDGTQWQGLGIASYITELLALPDGSVLLGSSIGGAQAKVLRYDGSAVTEWASLLGGLVTTLTLGSDDQVWCGGVFTQTSVAMGNVASPYLLQFASSCPAAQVPYGAGCTSSGGLVQLTGVSRPWLGGTWRARCTGLPAGAPFSLQVVGFPTWPYPMSWLFPEGQPGCNVLITAELIDVLPVLGGVAESAWPVPNVPALAGQSIALQHVPLEFGPGGLAVFSSNALAATVGSY